MRCPACDIENVQNALRCDCGYGFLEGAASAPTLSRYLGSIDRSLKTIKFLMIVWTVLAAVGFFLAIVADRAK